MTAHLELVTLATPVAPVGWDNLLADYAAHLHASGSTPAHVSGVVARCRRFARETDTPPDAVETNTMTDWLARSSWSTPTRKVARATLAGLFSWAHGTGRLPYDAAAALPYASQITPRSAEPADLPPLTALAADAVVGVTEHPARAWARQADYPHAVRGRLSADLLAAWRRAGSPVVSLADGTTAGRWRLLREAFADDQRARGLRPNTIALRDRLVEQFAATVARDPATVDRQCLVDYLARPGWQPATRKMHRTTLRLLFSWAHEAGRLPFDPSRRLHAVRVPITAPRAAPETVIRDAINGARPDVRVMILLGALAGLRRGEIAALHTDHITADALHVTGKGGRERVVPLHPALDTELAAYLTARKITHGFLFCPLDSDEPYTVDHVGHLISGRMPPGWSAHKLRTRFGSQAYTAAYDLRAVQELLGHSSPAVTARYIAVPGTALTAAIQAVPPVPGIEAAHPHNDPRQHPGRRRRAHPSGERATDSGVSCRGNLIGHE